MHSTNLIFSTFLIFFGATIFATLALFTRQSLMVGYIVLGILTGPFALGWVSDANFIHELSNIGIIFLLFLLGLHLHPQNLIRSIKSATFVTLFSSILFLFVGYAIASFFGFHQIDAWIIGATMMFSSTIIALKLLPTTVLHHQKMGEVVISVLLLQDFLAIFILIFVESKHTENFISWSLLQVGLALPLLILIALWGQKYILDKLFKKFDQIQEYIFLVSIGWCLGIAELGSYFNLSYEVGAFIAGVAIASSPISLFIAESLKPLRDFFLVMFFFSLGAQFDLKLVNTVILPSFVLAAAMLLVKPVSFRFLLKIFRVREHSAWEIGVRLGQISEFSLLVVFVALKNGLISTQASLVVQTATILTFIFSSYYVVWRYPTPLSVKELYQD